MAFLIMVNNKIYKKIVFLIILAILFLSTPPDLFSFGGAPFPPAGNQACVITKVGNPDPKELPLKCPLPETLPGDISGIEGVKKSILEKILSNSLNIDTAKRIAEKDLDGRSLEGLLLRVITRANAAGGETTEEVLSGALDDKEEGGGNPFHPDDIIKNVCDFYRIRPTQIRGAKRDSSLVKARQVAMYLLKKELGLTFVEIGNLLGGRDHTTIMYGVGKIELLLKNTRLSEEILGITGERRGKPTND